MLLPVVRSSISLPLCVFMHGKTNQLLHITLCPVVHAQLVPSLGFLCEQSVCTWNMSLSDLMHHGTLDSWESHRLCFYQKVFSGLLVRIW
jgi:hypothetical protein